jgi:hypothetical protein
LLGNSQASNQLEGCPDPKTITDALEKIRDRGWQSVSLQRLREVWPTVLGAADCGAEASLSAWSKDRIIKDHCQCCTTFFFVQQDDGGKKIERLQNIVINYTGRRREEIVATAKGFARATGLGESDLNTVGIDSVENFSWNRKSGDEKDDLYGLEVRFTRQGALWELYFNVSRHTMAAPASGTPHTK